MNAGGLAFTLLLVATAAWMVLPLLPAIRELLHPADASPLRQVGQDAGDLGVFAERFRQYVTAALPEAPADSGTFADGTPYVRLNGHPETLGGLALADGSVHRLVVASGPVQFAGGETFALEVYAQDRFSGGPRAAYRALRIEGDGELGVESQILRWAHADGHLLVGPGSSLSGRTTAGGTIRLLGGVRFSRLRATRVIAGDREPAALPPRPAVTTSTMKLPRTARQERGFIRVEGDLDLPSGATLVGTLVVTGVLRIGAGAQVVGDVKAHGTCHVGDDAVVDGAIVSRTDVILGGGARVVGPVVAEEHCTIGTMATIGRPEIPSSVAARNIVMHDGAQVFGAVSAQESGETLARTFTQRSQDIRG